MLRSSIVSIVWRRVSAWVGLVLLLYTSSSFARRAAVKDLEPAQLTIHAGRGACAVDLDAMAAGKTDTHGRLLLPEIDPTDHYVHVDCPGKAESTFFISPRAGDNLEIRVDTPAPAPSATTSALDAAEAKIRLRKLINEAIQLRNAGHFDEAVQRLHDAAGLDPANPDLHRELGITFLLVKEWNRARVEMLEAIRHEPDNADAHNSLGYALEKMGQLNAAVNEYRTATRLDPDESSYREHYIDALSRVLSLQAGKKK